MSFNIPAKGTTVSDSAKLGDVGETIEGNFQSASVSSSASNVGSISLTAGNWFVHAGFSCGATVVAGSQMAISLNSASFTGVTDGGSSQALPAFPGGGRVFRNLKFANTTTVYLVAAFVSGTFNTAGQLSAIRIR